MDAQLFLAKGHNLCHGFICGLQMQISQ